jgi:(2Fe-2S) ferredoxin
MGKKTLTPFRTEGRFLGFVRSEEGQPKYLRLQMPVGEYHFKLPKVLRYSLAAQLQPGDWIQVAGDHQVKRSSGEEKWVAYDVVPVPARHQPELGSGSSSDPRPDPVPAPQSPKPKAILVCGKSDCQKRGGREVIAAIEASLGAQDPQGCPMAVRLVGCMKNCKAGPNLVLPDKSRHSRVTARQIPELLSRHGGNRDPQVMTQGC